MTTRAMIRELLETHQAQADLAVLRFVEQVQAEGFSAEDSKRIFDFFHREKYVKFDRLNTAYMVKHGGLWEKDCLQIALKCAAMTKKEYREYCKHL